MQIKIEDVGHLSGVAQRKVMFLIEHKELLTLQATETDVTLTFDGSACIVDYYGRVSWLR